MQNLPHAVTLNQVLHLIGLPEQSVSMDLVAVALDSRRVTPGTLFLALPGACVDGRDFIEQAVARGAAAVLAEAGRALAPSSVPVIAVDGLAARAGELIAALFDHPAHQLKVLGVTGTNGKTSVTQFVAQLLNALDQPCGLMGTLGQGYLGQLAESKNTTADPISIQAYLASLVEDRCAYLAMEVSSHGLEQQRVAGIRFDTAIFTNLTRDHLDYHGTMEAYAAAKARLFAWPKLRTAVINADDPYAETMQAALGSDVRCLTYGLNAAADIRAEGLCFSDQGVSALLHTPWGRGALNSPLLGRFNLYNLLAALTALGAQGIALDALLGAVTRLEPVAGRLQCFGGGAQPLVVVDYAHTPDALSNIIAAVREHSSARVTCVFGCGGDRDRGKRALMARAAADAADALVVTSDNPRSEPPEQILEDILTGLTADERSITPVFVDRAQALAFAIDRAAPGEVVVVAGKGHEDYQEINGVRYPYSDLDEVRRLLAQEVSA